jgi:hypothetical protein
LYSLFNLKENRSMKRNALLLLALATLAGTPALAQNGTTAGTPAKAEHPNTEVRNQARRSRDMAQARLDEMAAKLNLKAEQKSKIMEVFESQHEKRRELLAKSTADGGHPDREAVRADLEKLARSGDAKLAKILTPEQMESYQAMREQQRARGAEQGKARGKARKQHRPAATKGETAGHGSH